MLSGMAEAIAPRAKTRSAPHGIWRAFGAYVHKWPLHVNSISLPLRLLLSDKTTTLSTIFCKPYSELSFIASTLLIHSSYWTNSIAEPEVTEQLMKHQDIEQHCAFSHFNRAVTVSNLFLVLILLTSFITPSSCTDYKAVIDGADVKKLCGAGEHDVALTYSALYKCCSDHGGLSSALSPLQTETAKPDQGTKGSDDAAQESFEYWVEHNSLGEEIASRLGSDMKIDAAKDLLASLEPPPPPSDTAKGYNLWLDRPRPTTIEEYLRNFEVIFVIDDSGSMKGERWKETRDALATIAQKTSELKVDTVSLRFLNDASYIRGIKGKPKLMTLFDTVKPKGWTPLGRALRAVFKEHLNRIDTAVGKGEDEYSKIPPLDIIVLTDGVPTDKGEDEPREVIAKAVKRLNDNHYHPNTMGVQIVQIANEEKAKKVLRDLVVGDNGRIVDTVPYAGVVDSTKLLRILLGGVHPNIRSQLPVAMLAFEHE